MALKKLITYNNLKRTLKQVMIVSTALYSVVKTIEDTELERKEKFGAFKKTL